MKSNRTKSKSPKFVEPIYVEVASAVRAIRLERGMSQETLARKIGIGRTSLVNFEAGTQRVMLHRIDAMAKHLQVNVQYLFNECEYRGKF